MTLDTSSDAARAHAFAAAAASLLPRAEASGERLVTALYLILRLHSPVAAPGTSTGSLTCAECRPAAHGPRQQYPCRTAEQAFWALDAILR